MDWRRQNDRLGVNKIGKNIKKTSLHQPNFSNGIVSARPQPQPQVYNISKNDFRSTVQQITGSPSRECFPQPPQNLPKPQNTRLQKIRPAALTQIIRPHVPAPVMAQPTHSLAAPTTQPYMHPLPHGSQPMMGHEDQLWSNTAESPVSVYIHYLQSSLGDSGPPGNQMQPSHEYKTHPPPQSHNHHSPRLNDSSPSIPILPSPRFNGPPQQMYNNNNLPSPRFNGRGILPSPTSQYLLQSPTAYRNFPSPRPPYPLLSQGVQHPSLLTPRSFSSMAQRGILGSGTLPQPPASPGLVFPSSPFGFFPVSSPRWRGY